MPAQRTLSKGNGKAQFLCAGSPGADRLILRTGGKTGGKGFARAIEATAVTRTGMRVGSPPFMAPEQVEGLPVSPATDVFALGSVVA